MSKPDKQLWIHLLQFLYNDVIPIVLGYAGSVRLVGPMPTRKMAEKQLHNPSGIHLHGNHIMVADSFNHHTSVFHQELGTFLYQFSSCTSSSAPTAVQVHGDRIFVCDDSTQRIDVFRTHDYRLLSQLQHVNIDLPRGIAISSNTLIVSNSISWPKPRGNISVFSLSPLKLIRELPAEVTSPVKIQADWVSRTLLVADCRANSVRLICLDSGKQLCQYVGELEWPRAAVWHGEDVIVCDTHHERIVLFDRNTKRMERAIPMQDKSFPHDVVVNLHNELFVCVQDPDCIHVYA